MSKLMDPGAALEAEAERLEAEANSLRERAAQARNLAAQARRILGGHPAQGGGRVPKAAAPAKAEGGGRQGHCAKCGKDWIHRARGGFLPKLCPECKVVKKK